MDKKTKTNPRLDHDALEAVFIANNRDFIRTAEITGVNRNTLYRIAQRKSWDYGGTHHRTITKAKERLQVLQPEVVHSVARSLENTIEMNKESFIGSMSNALIKGARAVSDMDDLSTLENSRRIVDLATAGKTIFNLGGDEQGARLQLNVLTLSAEAFMPQIKAINS